MKTVWHWKALITNVVAIIAVALVWSGIVATFDISPMISILGGLCIGWLTQEFFFSVFGRFWHFEFDE